MHGLINVKSPNNTSKWQIGFNSAFKGLRKMGVPARIVRVIKWRRMRLAGHVARMGERRGIYRVLVGNPEGKSPLGRPRRRWEDNVMMDF
jgi:hypothetical protein